MHESILEYFHSTLSQRKLLSEFLKYLISSKDEGVAMRVVTFKMDERLLEELDKYAMRNGMTRSDAIRKAILELLRNSGPRSYFKYRIKRVVIA